MKKIFICISLLALFANAKAECAELVTQPAYHSMKFYVYKPSNVPNEFFATYDGYLVYKDEKGVWNYASAEHNGIKKTDFVVGAVIPSVVMLKPYNAKISSVAPVLDDFISSEKAEIKPAGKKIKKGEIISLELNQPEVLKIDVTPTTARQSATQKSSRIVYTPPSAGLEIYRPSVFSPNASDWTQNSNFMAIGKWQKSIDRMGVLDKPATPVAWKGDYPEVVYAWTGLQWRQMSARGKHISALSTIRRGIYGLTVHKNKLNALSWSDDDTYVLSQYSLMWGYQWLGQIIIGRQY